MTKEPLNIERLADLIVNHFLGMGATVSKNDYNFALRVFEEWREQAVKDYISSSKRLKIQKEVDEFIVKTIKEQAVREVVEKIKNELPKKIKDERFELHDEEETKMLIMISKKSEVYNDYLYEKIGYNRCLEEVKDILNKLK